MAQLNQRWARWHCSHFLAASVCQSVCRVQEETGLSLKYLSFSHSESSQTIWRLLFLFHRLWSSETQQETGIDVRTDEGTDLLIKTHWISMNVSLTGHSLSVCMLLLCQHQLCVSLPSRSAHLCQHHKCQQSGIHLIHSTSRSISHPPVKMEQNPALCTSLFTLLLYSSSLTHTRSTDHRRHTTQICAETR